MENLKNKVALITGASSGIGEATALALTAAGVKVMLVARRSDRMEALAARIKQASGAVVECFVGDVADPQTSVKAVKACVDKFGQIDFLINNAGVMLLSPVDIATFEDWQKMINTNLLGLMYFTHSALPFMRKNKFGHIINISSVAGRTARAGSSGYNASKWGVTGFSEALRQEVYADRIRVTLIEPGATLTELTDHISNDDVKKAAKERVASMESLTSDDIAASIVYALSQPARVNVNEILIRPTDQLL